MNKRCPIYLCPVIGQLLSIYQRAFPDSDRCYVKQKDLGLENLQYTKKKKKTIYNPMWAIFASKVFKFELKLWVYNKIVYVLKSN